MKTDLPEICVGLSRWSRRLFGTRYYFYLPAEETVGVINPYTKEIKYANKDYILLTKSQFKDVLEKNQESKVVLNNKNNFYLILDKINDFSSIGVNGERVYNNIIYVATPTLDDENTLHIKWKEDSNFKIKQTVSYEYFIEAFERVHYREDLFPKIVPIKEKDDFF